MDAVETIIQTNLSLHNLMTTKWFTQDLFSLKWWGVMGFVVASYIICFWLMDKTRLTKTILFGSLMSVFSVVVDIIGSNANLWAYTMYIYPMTPSIFLYDITALPLFYMLIYQRAYSWKSFAVWNMGASAVMAFVFTPLLVSLGLLRLIDWPYINVFLALSFIGFLAKASTSLIFAFEDQYRARCQNLWGAAQLQPAMKPWDEHKENRDDKGR